MHHLRESRKVVVGDAGVLCGVIGWLGCHSCYHATGCLERGDDSTMHSTSILETWYNTTRSDGDIVQTSIPGCGLFMRDDANQEPTDMALVSGEKCAGEVLWYM